MGKLLISADAELNELSHQRLGAIDSLLLFLAKGHPAGTALTVFFKRKFFRFRHSILLLVNGQFSRRFHVFAAPKQDAEHTYESLVRAFRYFGGCVKTVLVDNQKAAVLKNNNGKVVFSCWPTTMTSCRVPAVRAGPEPKVKLSGW